jgi:hypothetical protein
MENCCWVAREGLSMVILLAVLIKLNLCDERVMVAAYLVV